jgi:hypothetical protein
MEKVELAGTFVPLWDSRGSLPILGTPRTGFSAGNELNLWDSIGSLGQNRQLENVKQLGKSQRVVLDHPSDSVENECFCPDFTPLWDGCDFLLAFANMRDDNNFKSTGTLIRNLIDIASTGRNYLLNVGPTSEGLIPQPEVERLEQIGAGMKVNGEAIYGTPPTIFCAEDGSFSATGKDNRGNPNFIAAWDWRCTSKPGKHFLHFFTLPGKLYIEIFNWPAGQMELPAVKGKITKAYLLADASHQALKFQQTAQGVTIQLPDKTPDAIASVLCLTVKGELAAAVADKTP